MTLRICIQAHATSDESAAIRRAIESLLRQNPVLEMQTSKWAAAARREALEDCVR